MSAAPAPCRSSPRCAHDDLADRRFESPGLKRRIAQPGGEAHRCLDEEHVRLLHARKVGRIGERKKLRGSRQSGFEAVEQRLLVERPQRRAQHSLRFRELREVLSQSIFELRFSRESFCVHRGERTRHSGVEDGGGVERIERPAEQLEHQRRRGGRRRRAVAQQVVDDEQRVRPEPAALEHRADAGFKLRARRRDRRAGGRQHEERGDRRTAREPGERAVDAVNIHPCSLTAGAPRIARQPHAGRPQEHPALRGRSRRRPARARRARRAAQLSEAGDHRQRGRRERLALPGPRRPGEDLPRATSTARS